MSAPGPPTIPPRPVRAQQAAEQGASHLPEIPPRPKRLDRSISPGNYPRSPLNEPFAASLGRLRSNDPSTLSPIPRPPSVQNLPSVGHEGDEYANIHYDPVVPSPLGVDAGAQTRNVAEDLHLHAPKPSLPKSSATAQVQAVTRTDPQQAAQHGFGKQGTPTQDEFDPLQRLKSKSSFSRPGSQASVERRRSIVYGEEEGPAVLGIRVPINPLLGDVQAPSPAPFGSALTPTHTGHNGEKRRHNRTTSGREVFLPPGSYGLHGHGTVSQDRFEKDWYAKHPDQLQHEEGYGHGVYESIGSGRGNYAMSSDDLNQIVRSTASRGSGFGTNAATMSYPDEQIGYLASEQYSSRSQMASPSNDLTRVKSHPVNESPLRKASFPADENSPQEFRKSRGSASGKSDDVMESENDDPVHVDEPQRRHNKVTGGQETIDETEGARPYVTHLTEEEGLVDEHGYSVPILASDEVAKEPGADWMHAAVSPRQDRRGSHLEYEPRGSGDVTPSSRPGSRPGSIYGMHSASLSLSRFMSHHQDDRESMHTPLEDVDEYEPLFPDEDSKKKSMSTAERFKQRPDTLRHRFPSQDIWEDTPSSAMYEATVSTPDLPTQAEPPKQTNAESSFEHPDVEERRKGELSEEEKKKLIPAEERLAKSRFAPHLRDDMPTRPGMQPRFPSQDIWEDSPESQSLTTTVGSPTHRPADDEAKSPEDAPLKPSIPPRPATRSKLSEELSPPQPAPPSIPARPQKRYQVPPAHPMLTEVAIPPDQPSSKEPSPTEMRKVPSIPDRPKPQIPPRPTKKTSLEGLSKTLSSMSAGSTGSAETEKAGVTSPPLTKPKPQIPARPAAGSKIANLRGNFMNDLNSKLGLGPPKEKEPEPEVEQDAKPLEDARKGRARGPQRRAPAKSPSAVAEPASKPAQFSMYAPKSLWHVSNEDDLLNVHSHAYPDRYPDSKDEPSAGTSQEAPEAFSSGPADSALASEDASEAVSKGPADSAIIPQDTSEAASSVPSGFPVDMPAEKIAQINSSTVADAPPAPSINTMGSKADKDMASGAEDAPLTMPPGGLAMNTFGEVADPTPGPAEPIRERSNPLEKVIRESTDAGSLSQHTTARSGMSGYDLQRAEEHPNTDAIPISKHTTHDSAASGATLEQMQTPDRRPEAEREAEKKAEPESVDFRHEQVSAPAPGPDGSPSAKLTSVSGQAMTSGSSAAEKAAGADKPKEPMNEEDVSYKDLEEMTAQADSKMHAPEEIGTSKLMG